MTGHRLRHRPQGRAIGHRPRAATGHGRRTFLKASHHYPEFIEVGSWVWDGLIEWHVRERQALNVTRAADGRYLMPFLFATVLLRPDLDDNYVSVGFDNEVLR